MVDHVVSGSGIDQAPARGESDVEGRRALP
jgi:hypothetical protein